MLQSGLIKHSDKELKSKEETSKMEITKETTMGEMLQYDMGIAYVLMEAGMHCVGCPSSIMESLEEACAVHGLDSDAVLASIQEYLAGKNAAQA